MPHRCKKILIFLVFFLDSAVAGQPSGWCDTSAGRGQESARHGPRRCCGKGHCLGCLAWLEPRIGVVWVAKSGLLAKNEETA